MNNTPDNNTNIPAGNNKRSSPLLKVLPIAVLAAVLVYFAAQVYNYFADPMTITLVYEAQAEDVISMEGWLVRTEEPLPGQTGTVSRAVQEGQRVAAGETVATVYSDDSALQTVSRIETLELQLQQLQFALTSYLDPDAALKLDTSITGTFSFRALVRKISCKLFVFCMIVHSLYVCTDDMHNICLRPPLSAYPGGQEEFCRIL